MVVATDRNAKLRAYAERRIETWAMERRRQERQFEDFRADMTRIRITNHDDGVSAAVFHGERHESRRERMLREHREQAEAELRKKNRRVLAVRRATGERTYCRHCGRIVFDGPKCASCKANPELITARGTEKRSFVPRPTAQPDIQPLSPTSKLVDNVIAELPSRSRDVLELRYYRKQSQIACAETLGISVALFGGLLRAAVADVAAMLANHKRIAV